jgi:sec-independent protein translocase protein TatA
MDFSLWQIAIVLVIALIVFGPKRLPELGKSLGTGMREFKDSITGDNDDGDNDEKSDEQAKLEVQAAAPQPQQDTEPVEGEVVAEPKA